LPQIGSWQSIRAREPSPQKTEATTPARSPEKPIAIKYESRRRKYSRLGFCCAFSAPKNSEADNEDCYAYSDDGSACAIADGATVSYDSKSWAQYLANQAVREDAISEGWVSTVARTFTDGLSRESLTWNQEAAFERGSFSTLSVVIWNQRTSVLRLFAVGDTNIFLIEKKRLVLAFPISRAEQFSNQPDLICSKPITPIKFPQISKTEIDLATFKAPLVCIATDALAAWLLEKDNTVGKIVSISKMSPEQFGELIATERRERRMRTDDTTFVAMS
jgi:hypothetical protein